MNINTGTGLLGFLLALSLFNIPSVAATTHQIATTQSTPTIEARLNRLTAAIRQRESQAEDSSPTPKDLQIAGWANGAGGRGAAVTPGGRGWANTAAGGAWGNTRAGGAVTGAGGGGFVNANPWRNAAAFANGGGFYNYPQPGTFVNGGGGFANYFRPPGAFVNY